jgi:outer membrane protein TolC
MMSIRSFLLVLALALPALPAARASGAEADTLRLSLEEALRRARAGSYPVRIAREQLSAARGQRLESFSGFLPSVSISEGFVRSTDPVTVFGLKLRQGIFTLDDFSLPALNDPDPLDNYATTLQVRQPIFNLDAIYGKSAAGLGVKAREAGVTRAREAVSMQVRKTYYGLVLALANRSAIDEAVTSARAHRDDAQAAFDAGLVTRADLLAADVRLAELEEQRIMAGHRVEDAREMLRFVVGIEGDVTIVPADSLPAPAGPGPVADVDATLEGRSDLRALWLRARASGKNVQAKRAGFLPRLNAFGAIEWNAAEAFTDEASNWSVGVQLEWKFFDGLGNWGRSRQAAAEAREAEIEYLRARERARLEVREAERAVQAAEERIRVADRAVSQAREALRIVEERYGEGLEKTSDLLDKEVALTDATLRRLRAQYDYDVAIAELNFALGGS